MAEERRAKHESGHHTGHAAEEARDAAERALDGEHSAVPPSELPEGKHAHSHAAHLQAEEERKPQNTAQGSARDEPFTGHRRQT